ncbi:MAG: hypothetical protein JST54_23730 [Deltaproteobacteria bacterium]|nr:hypothetical protein [Deltaproteobacteria bacterium]
MAVRVAVTIQDTMAFWNDDLGAFLHDPNGYSPTNTFLYEVPDAWVANGTLTPDGFENVFKYLYGPAWRGGNGDGSQYVVLRKEAATVADDDPRTFKPIS